MRIGIVGGTFDPFHRGHLDPVLAAREKLQWDRVLYIPAWRQPFKTDRDAAPGPHRFAMTALAIRDHDALYVSKICSYAQGMALIQAGSREWNWSIMSVR